MASAQAAFQTVLINRGFKRPSRWGLLVNETNKASDVTVCRPLFVIFRNSLPSRPGPQVNLVGDDLLAAGLISFYY
jgi:hypothetical protein